MKRRYGMKIWSVNLDWIDVIAANYDKGYFSFIELFAVPNSFKDTSSKWEKIKHIPIVIHGSHSGVGVNWADRNLEQSNIEKAKDSFLFADMFNADTIIFHSGFGGVVDETIRQLKNFKDKRIVIENKPYKSGDDETYIFRGSSPTELKVLSEQTGYSCCIDFAHVFCSATSRGIDGYKYVEEFLRLDYSICHFSDNYITSSEDNHLDIGDGDYDFSRFLKMVEKDVYITLETPKESFDDYVVDVISLRDFE